MNSLALFVDLCIKHYYLMGFMTHHLLQNTSNFWFKFKYYFWIVYKQLYNSEEKSISFDKLFFYLRMKNLFCHYLRITEILIVQVLEDQFTGYCSTSRNNLIFQNISILKKDISLFVYVKSRCSAKITVKY